MVTAKRGRSREGRVVADDDATLPRRHALMQNVRSASLPVWSWKKFQPRAPRRCRDSA